MSLITDALRRAEAERRAGIDAGQPAAEESTVTDAAGNDVSQKPAAPPPAMSLEALMALTLTNVDELHSPPPTAAANAVEVDTTPLPQYSISALDDPSFSESEPTPTTEPEVQAVAAPDLANELSELVDDPASQSEAGAQEAQVADYQAKASAEASSDEAPLEDTNEAASEPQAAEPADTPSETSDEPPAASSDMAFPAPGWEADGEPLAALDEPPPQRRIGRRAGIMVGVGFAVATAISVVTFVVMKRQEKPALVALPHAPRAAPPAETPPLAAPGGVPATGPLAGATGTAAVATATPGAPAAPTAPTKPAAGSPATGPPGAVANAAPENPPPPTGSTVEPPPVVVPAAGDPSSVVVLPQGGGVPPPAAAAAAATASEPIPPVPRLAQRQQQERLSDVEHAPSDPRESPTATRALALFNDGEKLQRQGAWAEAVKRYRDALTLLPTLIEAHNNLGVAYLHEGEAARAEISFRAAIALSSRYGPAHANLGRLLLGQRRAIEAEPLLLRAAELMPSSASVWNNLAVLHQQLGHVDDEQAAWQQALTLGAHDSGTHYNLALSLERRGDKDGARNHYKLALNGDPSLPAAQLAAAQAGLRRVDGAASLLK